MILLNRPAILGLTLFVAVCIGAIMQAAVGDREAQVAPDASTPAVTEPASAAAQLSDAAPASPEELAVTDVELTASAPQPIAPASPDTARLAATPQAPSAEATEAAREMASSLIAAAFDSLGGAADALAAPSDSIDMYRTQPPAGTQCAVLLTADPAPVAMASLTLDAPCHANTRVTFEHEGLSITEMTDDSGSLTLTFPALTTRATFNAALEDGTEVSAEVYVSTMSSYHRTVVQWRDDAMIELHAFEFGADYWADGHVWAETPGSRLAAAQGTSGLLTTLGRADIPAPRLAQVYTFPMEHAAQTGSVALSVEAAVTPANCGTEVSAQTLEYRPDAPLRVKTAALFMPECDAVGDFLVLKNLVEDLTIAAQ
ncbi:translocase [Pseudaestuariivita sp.]|uniref:translocase n=1 Tax=Pseudaestuariivita sp. TaxID=2211669 RepID=UPI004057D4F8